MVLVCMVFTGTPHWKEGIGYRSLP
jgi:hypothetical protein